MHKEGRRWGGEQVWQLAAQKFDVKLSGTNFPLIVV